MRRLAPAAALILHFHKALQKKFAANQNSGRRSIVMLFFFYCSLKAPLKMLFSSISNEKKIREKKKENYTVQ